MPQEQPANAEPNPRLRLMTTGESAIAPAVLVLAALLLCSTLSAVWWARATARLNWHGSLSSDNLAGIGAIVAAALTLLWIVHRRLRARLSAVLAIHEALAAAAAGETEPAFLLVNPDLGAQAQAWNRLVAETDRIRRQAAADRARQVLDRRQDSRSESNTVCDALPQGIIVIDEQSRITYANGAAAAFLRCKREEMAGVDFAGRVQLDAVTGALRELMSSENRRRQVVDVERKDDDVVAVLRFTLRPLRQGDFGAAMVIVEDITQQRCAETARHQFVAQATHELRTPLTNIRMYTETAIDDGENDPALRAKCLNVINGETRRLERIVGEMLSVAEIEAGSLVLKHEEVRLDALLEDLKADYRQAAAEKKIEIAFVLPPKVAILRGDRDKILLALHNLVGNALKYTPEGGRVGLTLEGSEKLLTIRVRDNGIGISDADAEKVFDRFYRSKDPRVAKLTGSGIGLTLAREVVRLHGGDITVESRLNEGSTFTMTLPI